VVAPAKQVVCPWSRGWSAISPTMTRSLFPNLETSPRGLEVRGTAMGNKNFTVTDTVRSIGYMGDMGGLG